MHGESASSLTRGTVTDPETSQQDMPEMQKEPESNKEADTVASATGAADPAEAVLCERVLYRQDRHDG